jgi:hypothetical protein
VSTPAKVESNMSVVKSQCAKQSILILSYTVGLHSMAYNKIRDEPTSDTDQEKEDFLSWGRRDESRLFSYRNLFVVAFILWIATLASLIWTLLSRDEPFPNHVATSLLFPRGTSLRVNDYQVCIELNLQCLPGWSCSILSHASISLPLTLEHRHG